MFGLKENEIAQLKCCFLKYKQIEKGIVFGSRAMGNYKKGSDVDIALVGENISHKIITQILNALEETVMPYEFDLLIFNSIKNKELIRHIEEFGIEIYSTS
ncbi:nucleotidyltransferase domain-containing protein [Aminipila sp.]|uniref:nucleotidyltransferase domain-containing protein n=1 Tax=Aminipila sp. TaxID=2060095 RepID=UPI0028A0086E|nr:nucleotidyltransferase domain-containing protein [Aminipila sp.]